MGVRRAFRALTVLVFTLGSCAIAAAQDERSAAVGGSVSAINMDARTSWSVAASFEYRFNRVAGLEVETTMAPTLKTAFPGSAILASAAVSSSIGLTGVLPPEIFPAPSLTNQDGRAVIFTNNVRVHVPTTLDRIDPYFVAGGGVSSIRRTAEIVYYPIPLLPVLTGPAATLLRGTPISQPVSATSTALTLTIGGGVGVRVLPRLWVEGDLRLFRLLETDDQNVGRFAVGARFRF
jgi:hypothetical protein